VSAEVSATPLATFEAKWTQAHPEFGLALHFSRGEERTARSAFGCLLFELEHAAFGIREMQPAATKLQWWAEEFARTGKGEARHPLTQALGERVRAAAIPLLRWQEAIVGALAQRDPEPAADRNALLDGYARLYRPLAEVEASLFGASDAEPTARVFALTRALQETGALADALRDGRLPLPLDLLARHRLARGDLSRESAERTRALQDWLKTLAADCAGLAHSKPGLSPVSAAMLATAHSRMRHAARAGEPLADLAEARRRLPLAAPWSAWQAARRSRR
jgi:15-cis-phytoene synthase